MIGNFASNTLSAAGNQYFFETNGEKITTRAFFKITAGGRFNYFLLYTNIIQSTYSDGSESKANDILPEWTIHSLRVARCDKDAFKDSAYLLDESKIFEFSELYFSNLKSKAVKPSEVFKTDEFEFFAESDEYICIETTFSGSKIPNHVESLIPIFKEDNGAWVPDKNSPLPCLIACDRAVKQKIAFLGDSITQGIGVPENSYLHWNALLGKRNDDYSYWNLGLGFGRISDVASFGIWFELAKICDVIFICFGVNDLMQVGDAEQIKRDIDKVVSAFKDLGKRVILQTLPPFDYEGEKIAKWESVNRFILEVLAEKVDLVFDCVNILGQPEERHIAKYGGHPNEKGCALWADALYSALEGILY